MAIRKPKTRQERVDAVSVGMADAVEQLAASGRPLVIGPFTGEVGYELLYWIPFVRWALAEHPALASRSVYVSRGGVAHWLAGTGVGYDDIFELYPPEELVARRPSLKQRTVTEFEEEIATAVAARAGLDDPVLLHPSILFNAYYALLKIDPRAFTRAVVQDARGARGLYALYEPLPPPAPLDTELPDPPFCAVRFYFRPSFRDTATTQRFAAEMIENLGRTQAVVLLNNSLELDDHSDFASASPAAVRIDHLMRPHDNLHVQTAILGRASAFVGTYGGLAYLAPFLGVPSLSFTTEFGKTHPWHLDLAQRIFESPGFASIVALRPSDLDLVGRVLGPAALDVR